MDRGIQLEIENGIAHLTLMGSGDLNLLGMGSFQSVNEGLDHVRNDDRVRALILSGGGKPAFSAGVDVKGMKDLGPLEAGSFIHVLHQACRGLLTLPVPALAAVRGPCLGGALELALACDMRIATDDAIFGLPEVRVGVPSVIEASLLPRTVGLGRARAMILTGEAIGAREALQVGLVDRVVSLEQLDATVMQIAHGFLGMSPYILSVQKDIIAKWLELGEEASAEYSAQAFARCFATDHPRKAMEAFLEKRQAEF